MNMYKQITIDKEITLENGSKVKPIATLADDHGGRCQILVDDHCYVLCLLNGTGEYCYTPYIFREAFEVLKTLPTPK